MGGYKLNGCDTIVGFGKWVKDTSKKQNEKMIAKREYEPS